MRFFVIIVLFGILLLSPGFALGALPSPDPVSPTAEDSPVFKGRIEFTWTNTGAPFYAYFIDNYPVPGEQKKWVVSSTSDIRYGISIGDYRWRVSSCSDREGLICGTPSATQEFAITPAPQELLGGIIPCGRLYDNTIATPDIDESEPCGLPHIILLLKNLLDFALWRLGLVVIAIMAVFTGAITYFSFGSPDIILRIKSIWKSVLVGYLIALFAWLLINVILNVLGFQVQFFGSWWQISF